MESGKNKKLVTSHNFNEVKYYISFISEKTIRDSNSVQNVIFQNPEFDISEEEYKIIKEKCDNIYKEALEMTMEELGGETRVEKNGKYLEAIPNIDFAKQYAEMIRKFHYESKLDDLKVIYFSKFPEITIPKPIWSNLATLPAKKKG
eukprot:Lithocolla_globosa_v1_NODE_1413_length_2596_cov_6.236128.p2 type:complete len:147 gc:universal NODE_1413_length_2596_cov_6.236128:255-695(+)